MKNNYNLSRRAIIDAEAATVFGVLSDIENWNSWTKSVTRISYLENQRFQVGGKAFVVQPKLSPAVWTITEIVENRSFVWQSRNPGLVMTAKHSLHRIGGKTFVEHQVIYEGILAWLMFKLTANLTENYLAMEIKGLKNKCEQYNQMRQFAKPFNLQKSEHEISV